MVDSRSSAVAKLARLDALADLHRLEVAALQIPNIPLALDRLQVLVFRVLLVSDDATSKRAAPLMRWRWRWQKRVHLAYKHAEVLHRPSLGLHLVRNALDRLCQGGHHLRNAVEHFLHPAVTSTDG